jgi:hypothetical protein
MGARNKRRVRKDGSQADGRVKRPAKRARGGVPPVQLSLMLAMEDRVRSRADVTSDDGEAVLTETLKQHAADPEDLFAAGVRISAFLRLIKTDEDPPLNDMLASKSREAVLAAAATHPLDDDSSAFPATSFLELVDLYHNAGPDEIADLVNDFGVAWHAGAI